MSRGTGFAVTVFAETPIPQPNAPNGQPAGARSGQEPARSGEEREELLALLIDPFGGAGDVEGHDVPERSAELVPCGRIFVVDPGGIDSEAACDLADRKPLFEAKPQELDALAGAFAGGERARVQELARLAHDVARPAAVEEPARARIPALKLLETGVGHLARAALDATFVFVRDVAGHPEEEGPESAGPLVVGTVEQDRKSVV